jgi:hypothetical protein
MLATSKKTIYVLQLFFRLIQGHTCSRFADPIGRTVRPAGIWSAGERGAQPGD